MLETGASRFGTLPGRVQVSGSDSGAFLQYRLSNSGLPITYHDLHLCTNPECDMVMDHPAFWNFARCGLRSIRKPPAESPAAANSMAMTMIW